ncbi:YqjF family protein [Planomicrobium sp. CPCC 101079]|uniref:YqjF family protein n=1 Tax=Planomicrobium sp. CPCC 101079 TaxID=2599618 RepID=UPI0011B7AD1A|nr:DUF2071 domain-containing protein [Planomicrobium sp. CPCC 101079]TWT16051.1 DUF2071 domain-containing protein [Planomicrobium sp. CPCC 101079]
MEKPWIMTQEWHHVLFMHWALAPQLVKPNIPDELQLDLYGGHAWISVVLFKAKGTRPRLLPPIPGARTYLELNVRTYVKYKGKSGVFFFSLDADSPLAVKTASTGNFLPYRHAKMSFKRYRETWRFKSKRTHKGSFPEILDLSFRTISPPIAKSGLENWLTERYCLWTKPKDQLFRVDIKHSPWQLAYVKGTVYRNTMASFLPVTFPQELAIAHYSEMKKVRFFPPVLELH